jgi:hypothetical protein
MPTYRVYVVSTDDHIKEPAHECADDQEAIGQAVQYTNDHTVELWQRCLVGRAVPLDQLASFKTSILARASRPLQMVQGAITRAPFVVSSCKDQTGWRMALLASPWGSLAAL